MSESIKIFGIKKPDGTFWKNPNGKAAWSSVGAAKNSWNTHNYEYKDCTYTYSNGKSHSYKRIVHLVWKTDAEPNGWSVVKLKEFKLVEDTENE